MIVESVCGRIMNPPRKPSVQCGGAAGSTPEGIGTAGTNRASRDNRANGHCYFLTNAKTLRKINLAAPDVARTLVSAAPRLISAFWGQECLMPHSFPKLRHLHMWWGGRPRPQPTPWSASSRWQPTESIEGAGRGRPAQARGPAPLDFRRYYVLGKTIRQECLRHVAPQQM